MKILSYFLYCVSSFSFLQHNKVIFKNKYLFLGNKYDNLSENNYNDDNDDNLDVFIEQTSYNSMLMNSSIYIEKDIDKVWEKMIDYNNLSEFIPNLDKSYIISTSIVEDKIYKKVFQEGSQKIKSVTFSAFVIMNTCEEITQENGKETRKINFTLDKSNVFSVFNGSWIMTSNSNDNKTEKTAILSYVLNISPKIFFPLEIIKRKVKKYIKNNLYAIKGSIENENENE